VFYKIFFPVFFLVIAASGILSASTYKFVDLGLQESDQSEAVAVNDNGQIVGSYWMYGTKYFFIWEEKEGISLIDLPETAVITVLNNVGEIAGNYKNETGINRGFIWDPDQGFSDIGTLGGSFTYIYDMNDFRQIVGVSESTKISLVDGQQEQKAFLWENNAMIDLGALTGALGLSGDRSLATSINNLGQIIGTSNSHILHKRKFIRTNNRSVFWQGGVIEEIDPDIEPQYRAWSFSINNQGFATYCDNKIGYFVTDLSTKNKIKIEIANTTSRSPVINDNSNMFLQYSGNTGDIKRISDIGFFKKNNTECDLWNYDSHEYVYLSTSFENPRQWKPGSFEGAYDFNNHLWVVGVAENIYGERHAVLLVPVIEETQSEPGVTLKDEVVDEDSGETVVVPDEITNELNKIVVVPIEPDEPPISLGALIADRMKLCLTGAKLLEKVAEAIAAGADVNDDSRNRHRPLQLAIRDGETEVARLLIENGADVHHWDMSGLDPIHTAINYGQFEIANLLIKYGAHFNSNIPDLAYTYPKWYAFKFGWH